MKKTILKFTLAVLSALPCASGAYTIDFAIRNVDGADAEWLPGTTRTFTEGSGSFTVTIPAVVGQNFDGWKIWANYQNAEPVKWCADSGDTVNVVLEYNSRLEETVNGQPGTVHLVPYSTYWTHTVAYDLKGGQWTGSAAATGPWKYPNGGRAPGSSVVAKTGCTITGWTSDTGVTILPGSVLSGAALGVSEDEQEIALTARWKADTYRVTLHRNGGTSADLTEYTYGVGATLPLATKDGFSFDGWYEHADFSGEAVSVISAEDTGDRVYYAKYGTNPYDLRLDIATGSGISRIFYSVNGMAYYDETASSITVPVAFGSTWSAYAEAQDGFATNATCAASGTMGTGGARFAPTATANAYALVLSVGTGIASIHYRTNATCAYAETDRTLTVPVLCGATWSAYATAKPGYTYAETSASLPASGKMGVAGAKFEPSGVPNTVCVRYEPNGATSGTMDDSVYTYDVSAPLRLNRYARPFEVHYEAQGGSGHENDVGGFTFAGWNDQADGTGQYGYGDGERITNPCGSTGASENDPVLLFAQWKAKMVELPSSTRDDYDLVGWYTAQTGGTRVGGAGDAYAAPGDITLYAHWTKHACTVTFKTDEGTLLPGDETRSVVYGERFDAYGELPEPISDDPARGFVGWYTQREGGDRITGETRVTFKTDAETLYARWEDVSYAITYVRNGGLIDGAYPDSYVPGKTAVRLPTSVEKQGAEFLGWYDNERFYGTPVTVIGTDETGDKTFYARWSDNAVRITYRDGERSFSQEYDSGTKDVKTESALFFRDGYSQSGWTDGTTVYGLGANIGTITDNLNLAAVWEANAYTVAFDANGGTGAMSPLAATYDQALALGKATCFREGHDFAGWALGAAGHAAFDDGASVSNLTVTAGATVTLYATWKSSAKNYTIHFDPGADVTNPFAMSDVSNCTAGVAAKLPTCQYENLASTGFAGWIYEGEVLTNAFINPEIDFDGQIVTVTASWKDCGELSKAVGLDNAVLVSDSWTTNTDQGASCSCIESTKSGSVHAMVFGPGKISLSYKSPTIGYLFLDAEKVATIGTTTSVYYDELYYDIQGDGPHKVQIYAAAKNFCIRQMTWTPADVSRKVAVSASPAEGGAVTGGGTYDLGSTALLTASPNAGYAFVQWSDGDRNATRSVVVQGEADHVAHFAPALGYVAFLGNGATAGAMGEQEVAIGSSTVLASNAFTRIGYTFDGWIDAKGGRYADGAGFVASSAADRAAILWAVWKPIGYRISFDAGGGTGSMSPLDCLYDVSAQLTKNALALDGYAFAGWSNATSVVYGDGAIVHNLTTEPSGVVTLQALWSKVKRPAVRVTLAGHTATKRYSGSVQSVSGYDIREIFYYDAETGDYRECDFTLAEGATDTAVGTDVGTYAMGLKPESFVNLNADCDVTFVVESDGWLKIETSALGGEPGDAMPRYGVSKFDADSHVGDTFDASAISNAFEEIGCAIERIEYAALERGPWSEDAPVFSAVGVTSFWYRVTASNYEPFAHEIAVKVFAGSMADPQLPAEEYVYDGLPHAYTTEVARAFAAYPVTEIAYSLSGGEPWGTETPTLTDVGATSFWYRVRATGYDDFRRQLALAVTPRDIALATIAPIPDQRHTGRPIEPAVTVTDGEPSIVTAADYDVAYSDNVEIGEATVTLTGRRNYAGTAEARFAIVERIWSHARVTILGHVATNAYDGAEHAVEGYDFVSTNAAYGAEDFVCTSAARAVRGELGTTFAGLAASDFQNLNEDFRVEFVVASDVASTVVPGTIGGEPGEGGVPPGGKSKYDAIAEYDGAVHAFDAAALTNAFVADGFTVTNLAFGATAAGPWCEDAAALTDAGATSFWYRVLCENYEPFVHEAAVTVTPRDIALATVAPIPDQAYTGAAVEPAVTVTDGEPSIVTAADYDVAYSDNVRCGLATVTVTGRRNYAGTVETHFTILAPTAYHSHCGESVSVDLGGVYRKTVQRVSGLPSGLRFTAKTGLVTGMPTKAAVKTVTITFADKSFTTATWTVEALPAMMVGTYWGAATVDDVAGQFQLKLTAAGKASGYFQALGKKVSFKSSALRELEGGGYAVAVSYTYGGTKFTDDEILLTNTVTIAGTDVWAASLGASEVLSGVDARRDTIKECFGRVVAKTATYDVLAKTAAGEYVRAKVTPAGAVTVSGKLLSAAGRLVSVSASTHLVVGDEGEAYCLIAICKTVSRSAPIVYEKRWVLPEE